MHVAAIIAAGGHGARFGADRPKQFVEIAGRSLLEWSLDAFVRSSRVDEIVVALPASYVIDPPPFLQKKEKRLRLVPGGDVRQVSVANAFGHVSSDADVIVIHDAARPFVTQELIGRTIDAAAAHGAAIAAVAARDTIKQAAGAVGHRVIERTLPRETIFLAQTPQAFTRDVLTRALEQTGGSAATDEAMLVERAGLPVHIVEGDERNIKVTTPDDLTVARARLEGPGAAAGLMRVGTGYDLHRLATGRALILGGVAIPFEMGLEGHSDADIVCHAVTDAVLGAASAGDIGRLFPDTDPRWKDADSLRLLGAAMDTVSRAGYVVSNVDVTIIAERPRLSPFADAMRANLARVLGVDVSAVSVKGKTNEKIGEVGRGEAMACHAVALLSKT